MEKLLREMHAWMADYMRSFYTEDEEVQQAIRMKEVHTGRVTSIAVELAKHLRLSAHDVQLAEIMGLFHDVGRFRQFTLYRTFNDAVSEDHAALGLKVLDELPFLARLVPEDEALVRFSILNHNKKVIAPTEDVRQLFFARLLRDADKLDIFRVLRPFLAPPDGTGVSPDFLEKFIAGEQMDYTKIRTMDDRKLVRLMWVYDVNFSWTLQRVKERGYIEDIIAHLPENPRMALGIERLHAYVEKKCAEEDAAPAEVLQRGK
ncbi:HD domain-containing protein [Selenomonas sputigena]|uniref:HD domain-containing protein n=1 Tax=Selenomonas sputigena TaxID=69823 RepID=UPI00222EB103|nr:HD domain-containing protein [Selenomonas sputigena]UZD43940.1 HD domain-containing protein [Selenomonas sputigena]